MAHLAPALAVASLLLPLAGAFAPGPAAGPVPQGDCPVAAADCEVASPSPSDLLVVPLAGTGTVLDTLGPFVSPQVRRQLQELFDLLPFADVFEVLPPRPQGPDVELAVNKNLNEKVAGIHVHEKVHVHAHVNASTGGPRGDDQVPCLDPEGCPDLVVDPSMLAVGSTTVETFDAGHCAVLENATQAGVRRLLRFTFTTPNVGDGDLIVGSPLDHPSWFTWGACHEHWHFRDYADYRLWTAEGYARWILARSEAREAAPEEILEDHPDLRDGFLSGHKQGFCVIDIRPYLSYMSRRYTDCFYNQGIRRGWADEYGYLLDGQWIDITDLEPGAYVLEAEVNPEHLYQELDYGNNSAALLVVVQS